MYNICIKRGIDVTVKKVKDFDGYYVTDGGLVYARNYKRTGRIKRLIAQTNEKGYFIVGLAKYGKTIHKKVHRLVAESFIPNPENKPQVNHIDGDKTNNCVKNLEWCTNGENQTHRHSVLKQPGVWLNKCGKEHHSSKPVYQIKDSVIIAEFGSICEAGRKTGIARTAISLCCLGKRGIAGGFCWSYK